MPITKSAKKALRQSIRRQQRNLERKAVLKTAIKEYKKLISANRFKEAQVYLPQLYKKLDKAAKTNLIKKNKASRLKSRLTKKLR
jgi:small subunit ribosomal protein S20